MSRDYRDDDTINLERIADALERIAYRLDEQEASRVARTRMGPL